MEKLTDIKLTKEDIMEAKDILLYDDDNYISEFYEDVPYNNNPVK